MIAFERGRIGRRGNVGGSSDTQGSEANIGRLEDYLASNGARSNGLIGTFKLTPVRGRLRLLERRSVGRYFLYDEHRDGTFFFRGLSFACPVVPALRARYPLSS